MRRLVAALALLAAAPVAGAGDSQLALWLGRSFDADETDVTGLTYRWPLNGQAKSWWWPQQLQLGAGAWRVPDLDGRTHRYDVSLTPVWRLDSGSGYLEGGIGLYLLSHTISNDANSLPTSVEFGSHVGAGLSFAKASVGLAVQHISNAGIKQPNGGINFLLLTLSAPL